MLTDQQGVILTEIQFGHVVFHDAGDDMKVWRGAGTEAVFEPDTQVSVLEAVDNGWARLPVGGGDQVVRVTSAGVDELEVWRRDVRSRH